MKRTGKKALAAILSFVMVASVAFTYLPSLQSMAAPIKKVMSHLVAGESNGNGHFGSTSAEAFVLSKKADITDEDFSFTMKLGEKEQARFRFVNKYADDTHWSYIAYDGMRTGDPYWFAEYKNGNASYYPDITGLPVVETGDVITLSGKYTNSGLVLTLENETKGTTGTGTITDANFLGLKDTEGKVGFGAGYRNNNNLLQQTEFYFADTTVGETTLAHSDFEPYASSAAGFTWETAEVVVGDDGLTEEVVEARKWFVLQGGSNNSGGHNYGNGASAGPLFYTDTEKTMVSGGTISLAVKPSNNWGVFYNYIDDNNWLYVGYDNSSKWYYQYKWNGSEEYPQISGLPEPVEGEELNLTISLSNETLAVTVNGTKAYVTNQTLKDYAAALTEANGNMGKFGVMTKGATKISFADFTYNNEDCMKDDWAFNVDRDGQSMTVETTAVEVVRGTVKAASNNSAIEGATVRVGTKSATTNAKGEFAIANVQVGDYTLAVSKPGYQAYTENITVVEDGNNTFDVVIEKKADLDLTDFDKIESNDMTVYVGKEFPVVVRYVMKSDTTGKTFFRANETDLNAVVINGRSIVPTVTVKETKADSKTYVLNVVDAANNINLDMDVKISVKANTLTWEVIKLTKNDGCAKIATIDIPNLNLLTVDASEEESVFAGAQVSTTTTSKADTYISFDDGFVPSDEDGYVYAFLSNGKLSAGLHSNSEVEGDKRVERINGADTMSLTSAVWYYECGDKGGQRESYVYPVSELPHARVAIADGDLNKDETVDWNDGAIAFRDVMHYAQGSEKIKDMVNYRIVMNFESAAPNPFLATADNIKKVYLATDGLPQSVMLKGYGNEGHDSANSEYADIAEREGGVEDFQSLLKVAHDYNTEIGIHVNAQEAYPEARSFNETMISTSSGSLNGSGWGWLDQSIIINKLWDLSSNARLKRFVQLYDRINETKFYSGDWEKGEYVKDSQGFFTNGDGKTEVSRTEVLELIKADAAKREDNMDFIYLDVWYQDAWETRRIAEEINSLGWRFSTEFSAEGEYNSTWQHWSTDTTYGGAGMKGFNSDIIRFLKNDLRDSQVLNWPDFGGTADNPLLGGYRLYGFEGWGGDQDFHNYIWGTFNENLPTKYLQQYEVIDWENYGDDGSEEKSPVGNTEKQITLTNDKGDIVVVSRVEEQRDDIEIERVITLNGKVVLNTDADSSEYLLPWKDNDDGSEKLYHWNLEGGTTTWDLQAGWNNLKNVVVYELSDQGRINPKTVAVKDGKLTLEAEAEVPYVVVKGEAVKSLKADFGEYDYVVDPGFNGYVDGAKLDGTEWSGDIVADSVTIKVSRLGDQRIEMNNTDKEVSVTTTISGLTKGEHYVAEIYVENISDAKATMTVDTGEKEVSAYTYRSLVTNYVSCDNEHGSKMQRIQVSFVAESDTAEFTLSREAGEGYTHWDDIRIVKQKLNNFKENGVFEQDFESVVQGLYPFVLGYNAGGDSRTHLSQTNAPYTKTGWNGRVIDDTIEGEWSLKHHTKITGIIYQTIPQNFRFEPGKVYTVEFDYQAGSTAYQAVVGNGTTYKVPTEFLPETMNGLGTQHVTIQVVGAGSGQTWFGIYEKGDLVKVNSKGEILPNGESDFILDNLKITIDEDAKAVTVGSTDLYVGEISEIYGSSLDEITWTVADDSVVTVDKANNKINAIAAGTTTVTATFATGEVKEFTFTVKDGIASDIDRTEYPDISSSANTEQTSGEPAPSGPASAATDGDSSTYWHSQWSGGGFVVSPENPAILTVDLGTTMEIGGFKFQQRNQANRVVTQYGYKIKDADGNVLASGSNIETSAPAWAWVDQLLDETVEARYIEFIVEQGSEGFACLAEIAPISVEKVATSVTLKDAEVKAGEKVTLVPELKGGSFIKGLVWTSSDKTVATVKDGVVTGLKAGTVTITLSNATGTLATAKVTVKGAPVNPPVDPEDPTVDKTVAQKYYDECTAYYVEDDYTEESWAAYAKAMKALKAALADDAITAEKLQAAVDAVNAATKALVEKEEPTNPEKPVDPEKPGEDDKSPSTGDVAPVTLLLVVMALAVVVVFVQRRRIAR